MSDPTEAWMLDRRRLLQLGLAGSAVLAAVGLTGSLAGCSRREDAAARGLRYLRDADLELFRALAPVVLEGTLPEGAAREPAMSEILRRIDDAGARLGPPAQAELRQLFDLLHLRPTRWLTTGVGAPWREAEAGEIRHFLDRWRGSSVGLFNAGYNVLTKLCCTAWFGQRAAWSHTGYPGPLAWAYQSLNA